MERIKKNIANAVTSLNLVSGCLSVVYSFHHEYTTAVFFLLLAAVFDFADGFVARLLHAHSLLGKELDSLGDMVSFGVAPGIMLFSFLTPINSSLAYIAFLIPVFSAYRLAKFNIDVRQTSSFIGLPTPANAIFWMFLIKNIAAESSMNSSIESLPSLIIISVLVLLFCFLMVSEIPMFSLKFKTFTWKDNKLRFTFLLLSLVLIVLFQTKAFPFIIVLFVAMSVASNIFSKKKS